MEMASNEIKKESVQSFQSTIAKTEKALAQMMEKDANTTLIEKRLKAFHIGLAVLDYIWHQKPHNYTGGELKEARKVLAGLLPSIEKIYAKSIAGSPQRTLLQRRIASMELAIQAIDEICRK